MVLHLFPKTLLDKLVQGCLQLFFGPGIQLLEEDDTDAEVLALGALHAEIVADLSAADQEAARVFHIVVGENVLEARESEVRDRR